MFETIKIIIANKLKVNKDLITRDTDLIKDLCADSLELISLLMILEEDYGIYISDDQLKTVHTVGDVADIAEASSGKDSHEDNR